MHCFQVYLPCTNGIYLIHQDNRVPVEVFMDDCTTGCGAVCQPDVYYAKFPLQVLAEQHPICHLKVLNILVVLRRWAPWGQLIHLCSDSATAVGIVQASRGRDAAHVC